SDLHSIVQPLVYAFGYQASTTACLPLKSASEYVLPSVPSKLKFGAVSPTVKSAAVAAPKPSTATHARAAAMKGRTFIRCRPDSSWCGDGTYNPGASTGFASAVDVVPSHQRFSSGAPSIKSVTQSTRLCPWQRMA